MPWQNPKLDWDTNPINPTSIDLNRIEENIDFLNIDIETKKGLIVDALSSVGIAALIADTHVQIASKIIAAKKTGVSITPGTANQVIPSGIYGTGSGVVIGDADLVSANIKAEANIFGVAGNSNVVDTSAGDAIAANILSGKKAYVDGALITGTIPSKVAQTYTPSTVNQAISANQFLSGIQTIAGDADLIAANILSGKNIFNVVGSLALKYSTLTASGTFIVPAGVTKLFVWMCGGGGSGGKETYTSNVGGGGGASGYPAFFTLDVTPGQQIAHAIGAAGLFTAGGTQIGGDGGDTVFGGITTKGGEGGGRTTGNRARGGNGGAGGGTTINSAGGAGGSGAILGDGTNVIRWTTSAVNTCSMGTGLYTLPKGGVCPFNGVTYCGGGGAGARWDGYTNVAGAGGAGGGGTGGTGTSTGSNGTSGTMYGAGGGGCTGSSASPGSGYQGVIFVGYFA